MCCYLLNALSSPQCTVGSRVAMRVGGDFFFNPTPSDPSVHLLLVAGGVGINPLYSILLHSTDLLRLNRTSGGRDYNISAHLCYSAKNTQELLFKVCIVFDCWNICEEFKGISLLAVHTTVSMCTACLAYSIWAGGSQYVRRNSTLTTYLLCSQSSIIEACREFPDKLSCDLYVTQQSIDVDSHPQPFINRKQCPYKHAPTRLCLAGMI